MCITFKWETTQISLNIKYKQWHTSHTLKTHLNCEHREKTLEMTLKSPINRQVCQLNSRIVCVHCFPSTFDMLLKIFIKYSNLFRLPSAFGCQQIMSPVTGSLQARKVFLIDLLWFVGINAVHQHIACVRMHIDCLMNKLLFSLKRIWIEQQIEWNFSVVN